jgi:hypothetical protein
LGTLDFNHAGKGLFSNICHLDFVNAISTYGLKLTEVSKETDSMFAVYVFLAFHKLFQINAYFAQNGMVGHKENFIDDSWSVSWNKLITSNDT